MLLSVVVGFGLRGLKPNSDRARPAALTDPMACSNRAALLNELAVGVGQLNWLIVRGRGRLGCFRVLVRASGRRVPIRLIVGEVTSEGARERCICGGC